MDDTLGGMRVGTLVGRSIESRVGRSRRSDWLSTWWVFNVQASVMALLSSALHRTTIGPTSWMRARAMVEPEKKCIPTVKNF